MLREVGAHGGGTGIRDAELERGPEVVALKVHALEEFNLTMVKRARRSSQPGQPLQVPFLGPDLLAAFAQTQPAELADGVQQPVPGRVATLQVTPDDRLLDERAQRLDDPGCRRLLVA